MVLVDTSVWIRFLANRMPYASELDRLLGRDEVAGHDLVYGELLIGDSGGRTRLLNAYDVIHRVPPVCHADVATFVRSHRLDGRPAFGQAGQPTRNRTQVSPALTNGRGRPATERCSLVSVTHYVVHNITGNFSQAPKTGIELIEKKLLHPSLATGDARPFSGRENPPQIQSGV